MEYNIDNGYPVKIKNIVENEYHSTFFYINQLDFAKHMMNLWEEWYNVEVVIYRRYKGQFNSGLKKIVSYKGNRKFFRNLDAKLDLTETMELWIFINLEDESMSEQLEKMKVIESQ